MAIVYRHIRLDKNEVFYIGIGKTKKIMIKKSVLLFLFLILSLYSNGQGFSYSFTDPCTFKTKQIFINNPNGSVALIYNGQIQSFTPAQLQTGALEAWITQVNSSIPAGTGPCGGVALTQNTTMNALVTVNTISVLNSVMSSMASIASMSDLSSSSGGNMLQGIIQSGEKSASSNQKDEDNNKNNENGGTNNNGGNSTTSNDNQKENSTGGGTSGNSNSEGQTNSEQNGESSSSSNSTQGGNSTSQSSVNGESSNSGNSTQGESSTSEPSVNGESGEKTDNEKIADVKSNEVRSSTQVKSKVSAVKQGNLMVTGDIVMISSASGNEPKQFRMNSSLVKVNTENTFAKGALINYTSGAQNSCVTVFYALRSGKYTTTVANSTMMNTQKDLFNTISIMKSYKSGKFTFTMGQNITTGKLGESKFKSLSTLAGVVTNFNINKSIGGTAMLVMVYSPYIYYYEGIWYKSGFMAVPFTSFDYRITKKFKLNLSFSGIQPINDAPLNYQILLGGKA